MRPLCPTSTPTRRPAPATATLLAAAALAFALAAPARADAVRVQFSTRVGVGERPRLTVIADDAIDGLEIELRDPGGRIITSRAGRLGAGARHEVALPAEPGRRRFTGQIVVKKAGTLERRPLEFETVIAPRLEVAIDRARVDVAQRRLEARLSRPAARVEIAVHGVAGAEPVASAEQDLGGHPAGQPFTVTWPAPPGGAQDESDIARIDLRFHDVDGFFVSVALLPWRISIPHEEVVFATDSATITPDQRPKLEASFGKIADAFAHNQSLGAVKLYIAGHTDTVGTPEHNLRLSRARAAAIATWFRRRGLRLPILYEGFGEHALAVATADETPAAGNRRVDYILALEDPPLGGATFRPTWRRAP